MDRNIKILPFHSPMSKSSALPIKLSTKCVTDETSDFIGLCCHLQQLNLQMVQSNQEY